MPTYEYEAYTGVCLKNGPAFLVYGSYQAILCVQAALAENARLRRDEQRVSDAIEAIKQILHEGRKLKNSSPWVNPDQLELAFEGSAG